jgi:hypothetical protein
MKSLRYLLTYIIDPKLFETWIEEHILKSFETTQKVRVCRRRGRPEQWIRFVDARDDRIDQISSRYIRDVIENCPDNNLCERLEPLALHAEMLASFVKDTRGKSGGVFSSVSSVCSARWWDDD